MDTTQVDLMAMKMGLSNRMMVTSLEAAVVVAILDELRPWEFDPERMIEPMSVRRLHAHG